MGASERKVNQSMAVHPVFFGSGKHVLVVHIRSIQPHPSRRRERVMNPLFGAMVTTVFTLGGMLAVYHTMKNDYHLGRQEAYLDAYAAINSLMDRQADLVTPSNKEAKAKYDGLNLALTAVVNDHGGLPAPDLEPIKTTGIVIMQIYNPSNYPVSFTVVAHPAGQE